VASTKVVNFDADKASRERMAGNIVIGGTTFHPRKRTSRLMAEWADVMPTEAEVEMAKKASDDNEAAKQSMRENPVIANRQLAVLIQDDQGAQPEVEFLCEHLDIEDTGYLIDELAPSEDTAAPAGGPGND
jgi:hypothetical protein